MRWRRRKWSQNNTGARKAGAAEHEKNAIEHYAKFEKRASHPTTPERAVPSSFRFRSNRDYSREKIMHSQNGVEEASHLEREIRRRSTASWQNIPVRGSQRICDSAKKKKKNKKFRVGLIVSRAMFTNVKRSRNFDNICDNTANFRIILARL